MCANAASSAMSDLASAGGPGSSYCRLTVPTTVCGASAGAGAVHVAQPVCRGRKEPVRRAPADAGATVRIQGTQPSGIALISVLLVHT